MRKIELSKRYMFWVDGQISIFFFNFDILMVISFRNHHQISYNTENKIWRELCEILFPPKIPKSEKQKHTILGNSEFKIVANFQVNCVKTKKDEWKWAFLMSHMPTVLVKLFWTFGIKIEYIEQSVWLLEWNFKKITNNQICLYFQRELLIDHRSLFP